MDNKINGRTPEEIKRGLGCCTDVCDEGCNACVYDRPRNRRDKLCLVQLKADALALIQQLESAQPKWISVEERLPEIRMRVLALVDLGNNKAIHTMSYAGDGYWSVTLLDGETVTHWMPLPEPPKED